MAAQSYVAVCSGSIATAAMLVVIVYVAVSAANTQLTASLTDVNESKLRAALPAVPQQGGGVLDQSSGTGRTCTATLLAIAVVGAWLRSRLPVPPTIQHRGSRRSSLVE